MTSKQRKRRVGQGALFLVAGMLLSSGLIRLGDGTGLAVAREVEALTRVDHKQPEAPHQVEICSAEPGVGELLDELKRKKAALELRETQQSARAEALQKAEADIKRQLAHLEATEARLRETLAVAESASENDLDKLTSVYENMKPKDAAALFEEMAPDFAAGFLARMNADAAAQVMAGLAPATAYGISVILAGRNADVPKE